MHRQELAPKGVDVVYDPVGGTSFEEALKVVKWGAQILIIGFASGSIPKVRQGALSDGEAAILFSLSRSEVEDVQRWMPEAASCVWTFGAWLLQG